jgi:hypothetical protein
MKSKQYLSNTSEQYLQIIKQDFFFFVVLGLELRTFTLSHITSPTFVKGFSR